MLMTSSMGAKVYLDKEIQTAPVSLILPIGRGFVTENDPTNNIAVDPPLPMSSARYDTAYIYAETQVSDESIPAKPSIPPRQQYAQLHYTRPSNARLATKRVASLPEKYTDNLHVDKSSQRVVSMPERLKPMSPDTSGSLSSLDISSVSFESNILDPTKHPGVQTYPCSHSDIPSTPSPPSSPESILIIGSNSQVPRTLIPKAAYKQAYGDNGGWISWANSPPRPIPALHGPLSLPYARCPSGAEGTIVEGEDLANMIWGLNVEETRSHSSTNTGLRNQYAPPRLQKSPKPSSCALPNDGAIDLSQLAVLRPNSNEAVMGQLFVTNQGANFHNHERTQHALRVGQTRLQDMTATGTADWKRGLGLNWQDPIELPPPQNMLYRDVDHSTLKASAPPFVPSNPSIPGRLTRLVVESCLPDVAQKTNQGQDHNTMPHLPTPPNTSSPLWSPHVATPSEMDMMSPQISLHGLAASKQLLLSHLLSPRVTLKEYTQDYHWVAEQFESVAKLAITPPDGVPEYPAASSIDIVNLDNLDESEGLSQNRDLNKATTNFVSDLASHVVTRIQQPNNGRSVSASPERRFRGISQQPRSIPLARLIHRRLSSVAEEDINALTEDNHVPPATELTYTITVSGDVQSMRPTQSLVSSDQAMNRTPSPDTDKLELRTRQEPDHATATTPKDQTAKKAVVKLPGGDKSLKDTYTGEKEKSTTTPVVTVKKRPRNRRNRSSPSIEGAK